jgi:hypothetical protein
MGIEDELATHRERRREPTDLILQIPDLVLHGPVVVP